MRAGRERQLAWVIGCLLALGGAGAAAGGEGVRTPAGERQPSQRQIAEALGTIPIHFVPTRGQGQGAAGFLARGTGYGMWLTPGEARIALRGPAPGEGSRASHRPTSSACSSSTLPARSKVVAWTPCRAR